MRTTLQKSGGGRYNAVTSCATTYVIAAVGVFWGVTPIVAAAQSRAPILLSEVAECDGMTDDWRTFQATLERAERENRQVVVDCPVFLHIGSSPERSIFMPSNTSVSMERAGTFIVDNEGVPAFVFLNSVNVHLKSWSIVFQGYAGPPTFDQHIRTVRATHEFFDRTLNAQASSKGGVTFTAKSNITSLPWPGPANVDSLIYMVGDTNAITIEGLSMSVAQNAPPTAFIRVGLSFSTGFRSGVVVTNSFASSPSNIAAPHDIKIYNWVIDGYLMGLVGTLYDSSIKGVVGGRYSDLQEGADSQVGGKTKWFPPPHLFYIYSPALFSGGGIRRIRISDVNDRGIRLGSARDKRGEHLSGNASSLKIGADDSIVENYITRRKDGIMDILPSTNLLFRNIRGEFDSGFVNGLYPGIRIPHGKLSNVSIERGEFTDTGAVCSESIISSANRALLTLTNVVLHSACKGK